MVLPTSFTPFNHWSRQGSTALTEEHMESLQNVNPEDLLWVKNQRKQNLYRAGGLHRT